MSFHKDGFYHLYNRGCNKEKIFFNEDNYLYLLRKIKNTYKEYGIKIISYCLLPNHYHFVIQQTSERPASDWIKKIFNGYVQAVNNQQDRSGTLFQGRVKRKKIDKENYLIHISRYIHYNPVEAGLVEKPEDWDYSNYQEWIGQRDGSIFDKDFFNTYFNNHQEYQEFMEAYIKEQSVSHDISKYKLEK